MRRTCRLNPLRARGWPFVRGGFDPGGAVRAAGLLVLILAIVLAFGAQRVLADCTDNDGDGYGNPGDASCPNGDATDCNDNNAAIHPGTETPCTDGNQANCCSVGDPPGCSAGDPNGCCLTLGTAVCSGADQVCQLNGPQELWSQEGPAGDPSCHDARDNNCNGFVDCADPNCQSASIPELCNGIDDNCNGVVDEGFTGLGTPCTVGIGVCERTGVVICSASGLTTTCSVAPGTPVPEGPPGSPTCSDGLDNDCDGLVDRADTADCCLAYELCNGIDDNCNGQVDETFTDLGTACTAGTGACEASGTKVCSPDGTTTVCNAVPGLGSPEGPTGPTCSDGIDNDCNGLTDLADPKCASANLEVSCALPYILGRPGNDCTGWHIIRYATNGGPDTVVTAELMGLNPDGSLIQSMPVSNGDFAHLASRIDPLDWKFMTKGITHQVFAPVPMLHVTAKSGTLETEAFCSDIPYLKILEPDGSVVSASDGDVTDVLVAIPRVDPTSITTIKIDGVEILPALGVDPATAFPNATPINGSVMINGRSVTITDLLVRTAPIGVLSSNTLSMQLSNLGGGGHIIVIGGQRLPGVFPVPPGTPSAQCLVDDIRDKATVATFEIVITSPTPDEVTSAVPTPVTGEARHGRLITGADINGFAIDNSGLVFTAGDGENSADSYLLPIDVSIEQTDLAADLANLASLGTFDPGSNRLIASATDDMGNRAFASFMFAVGEVAPPGQASVPRSDLIDVPPSIQAAVRKTILDTATQAVRNQIEANPEIQDAFVLGVAPSGLSTFFSETCTSATQQAQDLIKQTLLTKQFPTKEVSGGLSCNPTVRFWVTDVTFNGSLSCSVALAQDQLTVTVNIPETLVNVSAYGHCKTTFLGICISETIVDMDAVATLTGMSANFPFTETQFTSGGETTGTFVPGNASVQVTRDNSEINCLAGFISDVLSFLGNFLVEIFTFGLVDPGFDLTPNFEGVIKDFNLTEKLGVIDFPLKMKAIQFNQDIVAAMGVKLAADFKSVDMEPDGLTLHFTGEFSSTGKDPEIAPTPGLTLTSAPAPMPPVTGAGNTYFVLADDAFNQLFAAMTVQGAFKTLCLPQTKTIGDLAPADCTTLANAALRGACAALKGTDCGPLPLGEQIVCVATRNALQARNVNASQTLMFCAREDVYPRLLLEDNASTPPIETAIRLNDLFVSVLVDRDGVPGNSAPDLAAVPNCFAASTDTSADCKLVAACLDLNIGANLALDIESGKPKMNIQVGSVVPLDRPPGSVCNGGLNFGWGDIDALNNLATSNPIDDLKNDVNSLTPGLQVEGLSLGDVVNFCSPRLIAIETSTGTEFQDYVGVTGDICPPSP